MPPHEVLKAVAVDYQSMVKKPADFDAFWDGVLQQGGSGPAGA